MLRIIFFTVILTCLITVIWFNKSNESVDRCTSHCLYTNLHECTHEKIVEYFYRRHRSLKLSTLGAMLFRNETQQIRNEGAGKVYEILIWKYLRFIAKRHVKWYGRNWHDPLVGCSVQNCRFTGKAERMKTADAVIVHLHRGQIPSTKNRNPKQKWIFLNDESPFGVFSIAYLQNVTPVLLSEMHNVFNWSMMYRSDANVPVPYGRTIPLKKPRFTSIDPPIAALVPFWRRKIKLVAILISNCDQFRMQIVINLRKYLNVDIYGLCGEGIFKKKCPGHFRRDCRILNIYLFYLALEGANCKEYITEKVFYNAYSKGAIPIIQGASIQECERFLPPHSYLHLDNYASIKDLAEDVIRISNDEDELLTYHEWRNHFEVLNEHGYFGTKSFHFCRLCEALNYNENSESVYNESRLEEFLSVNKSCRL